MKKALPVLLLGVAVLLAAVAFGCGSSSSPGSAIDNAIKNSGNVKAEHVDFNVALGVNGDLSTAEPSLKGLLPLNLTIDGGADVDMKDANNPKAQGNIKIGGLDKLFSSIGQTQGASSQTTMGLGLLSGMLSNIDFVLVDNDLYIKVGGNWYDTGNLSSAASNLNLPTTGTTVNSNCYQNAVKDTSKFGSDKIFKNLQDLGTQSIDGANTHHYKADINFDSVLTQVASTARDCGDAQAAGGIEAAKSQIGSVFKTASVEMWIGDDNYFHQGKLDLAVDPGTIVNLIGSTGGSSAQAAAVAKALQSVTFNVTVKQSNINGSFNISKPPGNIQKLSDVLGGLTGSSGLLGSSSGTGTAAATTGG